MGMYWHNPARQQKMNAGSAPGGGSSGDHRGSPNVSHQEGPHHHASHGGPGPRPPRARPPPIDQLTYTNPKTDPKIMQRNMEKNNMTQMEKKNELNKLKIELLKKKQTHYEELT